jgi:hypothetical protein
MSLEEQSAIDAAVAAGRVQRVERIVRPEERLSWKQLQAELLAGNREPR